MSKIEKIKSIPYPFEFQELRIDDTVLDKLGFSEYWDNNGDSGERNFRFGDDVFSITCYDQKDDETDGYASWGRYQSESYGVGLRHRNTDFYRKIHFLHDLYEAILAITPNLVQPFMDKCRENLMHEYIEDYVKYKNENSIS